MKFLKSYKLFENEDERLNKRSFGEDDPIYPNIPLSERKKNRRVRISVNKNL